jgi:three-Cys-motif partner protein
VTKSRAHFDEFKPHSRHKHLILKSYFEAWGRKLLLRPGAGTMVCYVDACAGPGIDDAGNHGSPIIAAKAAAMAEEQLGEMRGKTFRVQVIAIEEKAKRYAALVENLRPFGARARALRGTLGEHLAAIEHEFGDTPTLHFIDPFGLKPLQAEVVRRALAHPKNEALILFADQAALRHFGAAVATETKATGRLRVHERQVSLFPELDAAEHAELEAKAQRSQEALEITADRAIQILDAAFGGHSWFPIIEATPAHLRREKFLQLYRAFLQEECRARYVLEVPVLSAEGDHMYFLVHATKSGKGFAAMKEAVEHALRHGPLPGPAVEQMWDLLRRDLADVAARVRAHFAGREVRWAPDKEDRGAECIRHYALEETPIFPFQLPLLKERLRDYRQPGRMEVYNFRPQLRDRAESVSRA